MKNYFKIIVLSVITLAMFSFNVDAQSRKKTEEVTFLVEIDCASCVKKLETNLPFEKGVKDLKIDMDTQTVWVKYQSSKNNEENLKAAIVKYGSKVKGVKPAETKEGK